MVGIKVDDIKLKINGRDNLYVLEDKVKELADSDRTHGIIIQLPVLDNEGKTIPHAQRNAIDYLRKKDLLVKDVDGMHPCSEVLYRYLKKDTPNQYNLSCTPLGVLKLMQHFKVDITHKHGVIIGRSSIVGLPLINGFLEDHYKMTITSPHVSDPDLARHTRNADLIIVAAGVPSLIKPDMIKKGSILIDIGINRVSNVRKPRGYEIVGDIDVECYSKAQAYTPVPGGIGPITVAILLQNTLRSALFQNNITLPPNIQL